jgi:hypothetical protein
MTTMPEVGEGLDAALAEKLGLSYHTRQHLVLSGPYRGGLHVGQRVIGHVSTDPEAAFRLMLWLAEQGWRFCQQNFSSSGAWQIEAVETVNRSYGEAIEREFPAALCTTIWRVLHSMTTKPGCPDPDEGLELRPEIIAKLQEPIDSDTLISHAEMSARLTHQRLMLEKVPCRKHKPPASRSQYRRFAVQCDSCDGNGEVLRFPTLGGDSRIPVRTLEAVLEAIRAFVWPDGDHATYMLESLSDGRARCTIGPVANEVSEEGEDDRDAAIEALGEAVYG